MKTNENSIKKSEYSHWGKNPQFIRKFTFPKYHFWQNSHFQIFIFHKNHIFKVSFLTKFTFYKHQILGDFWIKSWFLPQCGTKITWIRSVRLYGVRMPTKSAELYYWAGDWRLAEKHSTAAAAAQLACLASVVKNGTLCRHHSRSSCILYKLPTQKPGEFEVSWNSD